jgi:hypothetical protein
MNMKLAINKKMSLRIFNRAPINFWEPETVGEDSMTKSSYEDSICHEVKYDPKDKQGDTYKKYIKPFSHGTPEQWLKFMEDLNVVIHGNGLNNNDWVHINLTCSSLKGEALHVFNDKAVEQEKETKDTHIKCLHAITEHVFPKDNLLLKQKTYMCNHVFLHLSERQVSEFHARWDKINNCLDKLPPFQPNQCFLDEETKEILYTIILKCWQSYNDYTYKHILSKKLREIFVVLFVVKQVIESISGIFLSLCLWCLSQLYCWHLTFKITVQLVNSCGLVQISV